MAACVTDREIADEFGRTTDSGAGSRRAAVAAVAKKYGRSSRDVYAIIERVKKSGK
jgi:hypothetical protein